MPSSALMSDEGFYPTKYRVLNKLGEGLNTLLLDEGFDPTKYRVLNKVDLGFNKLDLELNAFMLDKGFCPTKYSKFIVHLRNYREKIAGTISHRFVPEPPHRWLDIPLIYGDYIIFLRVDPRNLYVRGYRTNKAAEFWEFSDSSLIDGSKSLPYSGSLLRDGGLCGFASEGFCLQPGYTPADFLKFIPLGYLPLRRAIVYLVTHQPSLNPPQSARCLLCIILMITEAARISSIVECVVENLWSSRTITLTMQSLLTALSMGTLSIPIKLYIAQRYSDVPKGFLSTSGESLVCESSSRSQFHTSLVSIYYVLVKDIYSPERSRKIYGTVKLLTPSRRVIHTVHNGDGFETKKPGEYLLLIRSSKLADGSDPFGIHVNLRDDDGDEIANGDIVFHEVYNRSPFDKHLEEYVLGKHCKVLVGYSVIQFAVGATIDVLVINNHGVESSADVHGRITASYRLKNSESPIILTLFQKSAGDCVRVSPGQGIPLTDWVFPVPVTSNLTIMVELSSIASGCVEFIPEIGTQYRNIIGEYRQVQVSVTCLPL